MTSNDPVRVGILDGGIDDACKAAERRDFLPGNDAPEAIGPDSHGAAVARIVRSRAPTVSLLDARVFAPGRAATAARVAAGLDWLLSRRAAVVTLCFGLRADRTVLADSVLKALERGVLLVASSPAAGGPVYPASYAGVIAVTGDARCAPGEWSQLEAGGRLIGACPGGPQHRPHHPGGGASMAAAHIAGELARLLASGVSKESALETLLAGCRHVGRERRANGEGAVSIRQGEPSDVSTIAGCARLAYARYVSRIGREPAPMNADFAQQIDHGLVHVAESGGRFAGYVVFFPEHDELMLENVAVLPEFAGRGIGRALIAHAESAARSLGLGAVHLYTNEAMTENLALYPRLGYRETDRRIEDGFRRVFFRKVLD